MPSFTTLRDQKQGRILQLLFSYSGSGGIEIKFKKPSDIF